MPIHYFIYAICDNKQWLIQLKCVAIELFKHETAPLTSHKYPLPINLLHPKILCFQVPMPMTRQARSIRGIPRGGYATVTITATIIIGVTGAEGEPAAAR